MNQISQLDTQFWTRANRHLLHFGCSYNVITQVGNYGEMYDRDITPLGLARGQNALTSKGGLQSSPLLR